MEHKRRMKLIDDFFNSISVEEFERTAIAAGAVDLNANTESENCTGKIVLHKGKRADNGEEITGLLTNMFGQYHIVLEEDENTAYPVEEDSIKPCLKGIGLDNGKELTGFLTKMFGQYYRNRWYVNEKMLPRLQDTVLICKGWYNKEKYPNVYEALRAYWAAIAEVSVEDIGYDAVLQCLLLPACEAFLCNRKFCELFYERIYKLDIVMREFEKIKKHKNKAEYREMNAEYLIEILTDALFALRNDEYSSKKRPEDGYCVV
jgi:hypothetical protein